MATGGGGASSDSVRPSFVEDSVDSVRTAPEHERSFVARGDPGTAPPETSARGMSDLIGSMRADNERLRKEKKAKKAKKKDKKDKKAKKKTKDKSSNLSLASQDTLGNVGAGGGGATGGAAGAAGAADGDDGIYSSPDTSTPGALVAPLRKASSSMNVQSPGGDAIGGGESDGSSGSDPAPARPWCRRLVTAFLVVLLVGGGVATYLVMHSAHHGGAPSGSVPWKPLHPPSGGICVPPAADPFYFWRGLTEGKAWYDKLSVNINTSFQTSNATDAMDVQVDWGDHYAVQLFANPDYLKIYDDAIRAWNPKAQNRSGAIDSCGWPLDDPSEGQQVKRFKAACFYEDFSKGWDSSRITVGLVKGCCDEQPVRMQNQTFYPAPPSANPPPYSPNINIDEDNVEYPPGNVVHKNVLRLTSINEDDPQTCGLCVDPPCKGCHKAVRSNGVVQTFDTFASARFDVVAKVPRLTGLVWAMWTFHYEEHLPWPGCSDFGCYKQSYRGVDPDFEPKSLWTSCCKGIPGCCNPVNVPHQPRPANCPPPEECPCCAAFLPSGPCANATLCDKWWTDGQQQCMRSHKKPNPQFTNNATVNSWKVIVNHEIDIEIPANCMGTSVCSETAPPEMNFTERQRVKAGCINRFNTLNMNNYISTTGGGTGPAYSNMCARVTDKGGNELQLLGDGKYHKYTIDWHTGGTKCTVDGTPEPGRVDFYIDDTYVGTNNVFVPTRGSKLVMGAWPGSASGNAHMTWNNWPDDWGGLPGDKQNYLSHTYISEIRATPHNEPNDVMYPASFDQPDGCVPFYLSNKNGCHLHWKATNTQPPMVPNAPPGPLATEQCTMSPSEDADR